jgi:hypothetical protein
MPDGCGNVWELWQDINSGLDGSGMGPATITWTALRAWESCNATKLEAWEIKAIKGIHGEWLAALKKSQKKI